MTYIPNTVQPWTVVRGSASSRWNDQIDSNTNYLYSGTNNILLNTGFSFPMFAETHLSYDSTAALGNWYINTPYARYKSAYLCDFLAGYGARAISDDKAVASSTSSFTKYTGSFLGSATNSELNEQSCATIIFFGASS